MSGWVAHTHVDRPRLARFERGRICFIDAYKLTRSRDLKSPRDGRRKLIFACIKLPLVCGEVI